MSNMQEFFQSGLERRGFTVVQTGGGCTAWSWRHMNYAILITQDSSHEIEEEFLKDQGICFTVYTDHFNNEFDTYQCDDYMKARQAISYFQKAIEWKVQADQFFREAQNHAWRV